MYQEILIATDGSELASVAAEQGLAVAEQLGANVHVLSIIDDGSHSGGVRDHRRDDFREAVERVADSAAERDVVAETAVRNGRPHREILAYADEHTVDLLVLGTHGRTGVRRWILGSVATSVLRESRRPVLTVSTTATDIPRRFDDVLVATDERHGADGAIDHGIALAEAYGATIHALYVVDDTVSRLPAVLEEFERQGSRATATVETRAATRGLDTIRAIERGVPHSEIVEYADARSIDLLVVGTEGRTGLDRLAFGSVSQRVVGSASVPVLTVRSVEER
ncbi:universal stress protein [Natrinema soli]|uniref:Universal stress protein n=1 Tax=Natrinema soli TaxID=1930624 RepID=A0ABD5SHH4_9EURY|nr:universal stress protein [Natrinema soli]